MAAFLQPCLFLWPPMLVIEDGGQLLLTSQGVVGRLEGGDNNSVTITGMDSLWDVGDMILGDLGDYSSMLIDDGGTLDASGTFTIGNQSNSNNLEVADGGSLNAENLSIGTTSTVGNGAT